MFLGLAVAWWALASHRRGFLRVGGRLGEIAPVATVPQQAANKVRLGPSTRTAVRAVLNDAFEAEIDPSTTVLTFSIGARAPQDAAAVTFFVSADSGNRWQTVFVESVQPGSGEWLDRTVQLEATGTRRLRFQVGSRGDGDQAAIEAYWGAVMTLHPEGALAAAVTPPANVILISLDTLSANYLTSFGYAPGVSPHIDDILARSFSFRNAYAQYPNTPVSHASIFTGLYPKHHHVYETNPWLRAESLVNAVAAHGYVTVGITEDAFVSSDFGFDAGFDWYDNGNDKTANADDKTVGHAAETFDKAQHWLDEFGARAPFFLFVHTYEVHTPYRPEDAAARAVADRIDPGYTGPFVTEYPGKLFELGVNTGYSVMPEEDLKRLAALYAGEISYLDRVVGEFIARVARSNVAERTLVVLTADHGEEFGRHGKLGHGETLYNQALHVPLGFFWPARIKPGTNQSRVELIDVLPTVLDLIEVRNPEQLDGTSLLPVIRGNRDALVRPAFAELQTAFGDCRRLKLPDQCHVDRLAVQTERFKLITSKVPVLEELYDLQNDPQETHEVGKDFPDELQRHRALLARYSEPEGKVASSEATPVMDDATRERLRALGYLH